MYLKSRKALTVDIELDPRIKEMMLQGKLIPWPPLRFSQNSRHSGADDRPLSEILEEMRR